MVLAAVEKVTVKLKAISPVSPKTLNPKPLKKWHRSRGTTTSSGAKRSWYPILRHATDCYDYDDADDEGEDMFDDIG